MSKVTPDQFISLSVAKREEILHKAFLATAYQSDAEAQKTADLIAKFFSQLKIQEKTGETTAYYATHYSWLRFLQKRENLEKHIALIRNFSAAMQKAFPGCRLDIEVYPYRRKTFEISTQSLKTRRIRLNELYITMSREDCELCCRLLKQSGKRAGEFLRKFYDTPESKKIRQLFENDMPQKEVKSSPKGRYFDLEEVFRQVNQTCFSGTVAQPALQWTAKVNLRLHGSYAPAKDLIRINRGLDDPSTPNYVIEFVMYHEILHKYLGVKEKNGRRLDRKSVV